MTDRLTQLQEAVNCQAENFCNALGILQQSAPPSSFSEFPDREHEEQTQENYPKLFATYIAKTAKDIDVLIESLPNEELTPELQAASLRRFESDNQEAAAKLEEAVKKCEDLLNRVRKKLKDIAREQIYNKE